MSESDLAERLDAVERTLTDDETDLTDVRDSAALSTDVDRLEARVDELEATVDELEAAVEAVRGYAGNVRAVNREVERRASAALAKAETLETAVDGADAVSTPSRSASGRETESADHPVRRPSAERSVRQTSAERSVRQGSAEQPVRPVSAANGRGDPRTRTGPDDEHVASQSGEHEPAIPETGPNAGSERGTDEPARDDGQPRSKNARRTAADAPGRRPGHASRQSSTESADAATSQTEAFIERVRDAL